MRSCYTDLKCLFFRKLFTTDLYIKIRKNRLEAKNLSFDEGWKRFILPSHLPLNGC